MEGHGAADGDDQCYVTMDADKWSEHDNTYVVLSSRGEADSRGQKKEKLKIEKVATPDSRGKNKEKLKIEKVAADRPLVNTQNPTTARPPIPPSNRYIAIRRPPMNAKRGKETPQLVFLRRITVYLVLLCILCLGGMLFVTIWHFISDETGMREVHKEMKNVSKFSGSMVTPNEPLTEQVSHHLETSTIPTSWDSTENVSKFSGSTVTQDEDLHHLETSTITIISTS